MMRLRYFIPATALVLLTACGGSSTRDHFSSMQYNDPSSTGWRLVKDASTTPTHLVLDLVGPTGTKARGVALSLKGDPKYVQYAKFTDGSYIKDGGVFELTVAKDDEPKLLAGGVKDGQLMLGIFQKGTTQLAKDSGKTLLKCSLDLKSDIPAYISPIVNLKIIKAQILPETLTLIAATPGSNMQSIDVAVGTIVLK